MFEKKRTLTYYPLQKLQKQKREQLNRIALEWGMAPSEGTTNDDLVEQISAQQKHVLMGMTAVEQERLTNLQAVPPAWRQEEELEPEPEPNEPEPDKAAAVAAAPTAPPVPPVPMAPIPRPLDAGEERLWFRVAAGASPSEKGPVFAALNGDSIQIKRGAWVKIRRKYLPLFEDAVVTEVELDANAQIKGLRHVPRFNIHTRSLEEGVPTSTNQLSQF